jgi:hypothetical protein
MSKCLFRIYFFWRYHHGECIPIVYMEPEVNQFISMRLCDLPNTRATVVTDALDDCFKLKFTGCFPER